MDHFLHHLYPNPGWSQVDIKDLFHSNESIPLKVIGKHCILELYDCDQIKLNDEAFVRTTITASAKLSGATLINLMTHRFTPQGVTGLALLAESHISIHTWPENGYGAVDVFTCGEHTMPEKACEVFIKEFSAKRHFLRNIQRQTPQGLSNDLRNHYQ
tara:strand:+ start:16543 stop:17016 length:474 start_codon:yes stop_codon:yes gene_type:complete